MLSISQAMEYIQKHYTETLPRLQKLEDYYLGKNAIKKRKERPNEAVTNRVAHSYGDYIVKQTSSYFMGKPIDYVCPDDTSYLELDKILRGNDSSSLDMELTLDMSVFGQAYELLYIDSTGALNLAKLHPKNTVVLFDGAIKPLLTDAIVYDVTPVDAKRNKIRVYIYDNVEVQVYSMVLQSDFITIDHESLQLEQHYRHNLNVCPVIEYKNNLHQTGDFELVTDLIDTYDLLNSLSFDDSEDFTNAYLTLTGVGDINDEIKEKIRHMRILSFDEKGSAGWLTKDINDTFVENLKNRVNKDIHKLTGTLDTSDSNLYSGVASGVALKWRYSGLELKRKEKERYFRIGIRKRLNIISGYLAKLSRPIDVNMIDVRFSADLPVNVTEEVANATAVAGLVSKKTQLSLLPFVDDVELELDLLKEENVSLQVDNKQLVE